jgi:hypothetical protein
MRRHDLLAQGEYSKPRAAICLDFCLTRYLYFFNINDRGLPTNGMKARLADSSQLHRNGVTGVAQFIARAMYSMRGLKFSRSASL